MSRHMKVHQLLDRQELDELEDFAREPGRTVDDCLHWLVERDFAISRGAVHNWLREFKVTDKFKIANDAARSVMEAAKEKDAVELGDAAIQQFGQIVFEKMLSVMSGEPGQIDMGELQRGGAALRHLVMSKRHVEKLKEEMAATHQRAVDEATKAAEGGASGEAVVAKVREILGVA